LLFHIAFVLIFGQSSAQPIVPPDILLAHVLIIVEPQQYHGHFVEGHLADEQLALCLLPEALLPFETLV